MTYPQALEYLESLINYERIPDYPYKESLKLERVGDFLALLGNPQEALKSIHIAGTKGKGSTCAFIAHILKYGGYKTGLYTSPHLSDFRERIRILDAGSQRREAVDFEGMIPKSALARLVKRLKPEIENYNKRSEYGPLSFFEVYTALAFTYFKEKKVDFAVVETGLGGRLDATNTVDPLVCVITPISYEHTDKLGKTLCEIAAEKAGIIKSGQTVISAPQKNEALTVIKKRCREMHAGLREAGNDIAYKISLIGKHQAINASVALEAIKALSSYGFDINEAAIRRGLANTLWPGRCEIVSREPLIIVDGAQNRASSRALKETIESNFNYDKLTLVLGISNDKDIRGISDELKEIADEVILTRADNPRASSPASLLPFFRGKKTRLTKNLKDAKKLALSITGKKGLILVTGSLFILGEFRK